MDSPTKPLNLIGIIRRNLFRQPVRTGLCALGVAIGVLAIVAIGAIARGLTKSIQTGIHYSGSDLVIYQAGTSMDFLSALDEQKTRAALGSDPDVLDIAAGQSQFLTLEGNIGSIVIAIGIDPHEFLAKQQGTVKGRLMQSGDEVVIGTNLERRVHKAVGDRIKLGDRIFTISGVARTGNVFFDSAAILDIRTLQDMMGRRGKVTCFYAKLRPGVDPYKAADRIERDHPELAAVAGAEQYNKIDQGLEYADATVWAVSFIALIVGGLVVANTMWMSVNQRTREIGVLRALGWSRKSVMGMIIFEALGIGMIACLVGAVSGVGLAMLTTVSANVGQFVDPVFAAPTFVQAFVVALLLSVAGAALPAIRAANISPVEALRHE